MEAAWCRCGRAHRVPWPVPGHLTAAGKVSLSDADPLLDKATAHTLWFLNGLTEILFIHDAFYLLEVQWNGFGLHIINSSKATVRSVY